MGVSAFQRLSDATCLRNPELNSCPDCCASAIRTDLMGRILLPRLVFLRGPGKPSTAARLAYVTRPLESVPEALTLSLLE